MPYESYPSVRQRVKSSVDGRTTINPAMSAVASHRNISARDDFDRKGTKNIPNDQ